MTERLRGLRRVASSVESEKDRIVRHRSQC